MLQRNLLIAACTAAIASFGAYAGPAGGGMHPPHIAQPMPNTTQPVNNQGAGKTSNTTVQSNPGQSHGRAAYIPQPKSSPLPPDAGRQLDPPG